MSYTQPTFQAVTGSFSNSRSVATPKRVWDLMSGRPRGHVPRNFSIFLGSAKRYFMHFRYSFMIIGNLVHSMSLDEIIKRLRPRPVSPQL
jgi:hypothetical protein